MIRYETLSFGSLMKTKIVASKLSEKQSKIIAAELRKIEAECSIITPKLVVARASDKRNPMHGFFEWDDTAAAERYREWQARSLILKVYVVPSDQPDSEPVRAFVNIKSDEDDELVQDQGYVWTAGLETRPVYQAQVVEYAAMQLRLWRKKFGALKEFLGVVKEIDSLK